MAEVYDTVPPLDVLGLLAVVWRGKWLIALTTICAIILGGYYAFHMVGPRYGATAALQIDLQPTTLPDVSDPWTGPGTDPASLNTEVTVLTSNRILGQVVDDLDLLADPEFNRYLQPQSPYAINAIRGRIRHFLAGTTDVPPDTAAIYEKTIQNLRSAMTATRPRDTYLFEITARSARPEKAVTLANAAAAIYVADQLRIRDETSQAAESWLNSRVATLREQLEQQEIAVTTLIATAQIQQDAQLDALSNQVLAAEQALDQARTVLTQMEAQNSTTIAQQRGIVVELTGRRDLLRSQLSAQSAGLVSLHQMQREADATRALYETFLTRLQQTRLQRGLEHPNSQIIAPATAAQYLGPRKTLIVTIAAFLGGLLGFGLVGLREALQTSVRDVETLHNATRLPVIAQISHSETNTPRKLRLAIAAGGSSTLGQATRAIRAQLMLASDDRAPTVIACTSSIAGEGKTAHSLALANALANGGKRVLLLSMDQTNGGLIRHLNIRPHLGLSDVIAGNVSLTEATMKDAPLGFDVLLGRIQATDQDITLTDSFGTLMDTLRDTYDHVIINAPPVLDDPTTTLLAQHADAVIYAVRWSKTPLRTVQSGLARLDGAAAPATGLILSKVGKRAMAQRRRAAFATG